MTTDPRQDVLDEAIHWHVRIADGSEADWEAFTAWLDADPAHARAYDEVEAADHDYGLAVSSEMPAPAEPVQVIPVRDELADNDNAPVLTRRRWLGGMALAASIAVAAFFGFGLLDQRDPYAVATAPGQTRTVMLESGDRIELNGGTTLALDHDNPRFAAVEQGEATFNVRHLPDKPFIVLVGDDRIEDIGTVFNVVRGPGGVRVAVSEGSIVYNPDAESVTLNAGQALSDAGDAAGIVVKPVEPAMVGSWRTGRLSYIDAPLSQVAADLARTIGEDVSLAPALANRPFSGTIVIDADRTRLFNDLASLLGARAVHEDGGWTLVDPERAPR